MKKVLIPWLIALLFWGCRKYNENRNDLSGDLYFRGRAFLSSDLQDSSFRAIGNMQVKIGYRRDNAINFLFTVNADTAGYFLFQNIKKDTLYSIFAEFEENGIKYSARLDTALTKSADSSYLIFKPDELKQNGFSYTVVDKAGGPVNGANICVFTSYIIANDSCAGSTYLLTTKAYGKASMLNVPTGNYIAFIKAKFGNLILTAKDTIVNMQTGGIVRRRITVK